MNIFLVTLSLAAFAAASPTSGGESVYVQYLRGGGRLCRRINSADVVPCPPAERNGCNPVDCTLPGNQNRLHPHPDPNYYYQCEHGVPIVRPCACGTLFSSSVDDCKCVHPHEWERDCAQQPQNPILSQEQCTADDDCDSDEGVGGTEPWDTTTTTWRPDTTTTTWRTETTTNGGGGGDDGNGCQCPCVPCVWWPCMPCLRICPCPPNGNRQQPIQRLPENNWQQQPNQRIPQNNWQQRPNQRIEQDNWQQHPQWFSLNNNDDAEVAADVVPEQEEKPTSVEIKDEAALY